MRDAIPFLWHAIRLRELSGAISIADARTSVCVRQKDFVKQIWCNWTSNCARMVREHSVWVETKFPKMYAITAWQIHRVINVFANTHTHTHTQPEKVTIKVARLRKDICVIKTDEIFFFTAISSSRGKATFLSRLRRRYVRDARYRKRLPRVKYGERSTTKWRLI